METHAKFINMPKKFQSKYSFNIGDIIGNNQILGRVNSTYICKCICGKSDPRILEPYQIIAKRKCKECGNSRPGKLNPAFKGYEEMYGDTINQINQFNTRHNFASTDLTVEYLWEMFIKQNRRCAISNLEIKFRIKNDIFYGGYEKTASLDRINSKFGYVKDNVHWVHKDINRMKNKFSMEYFIWLCNKISENNKIDDANIDLSDRHALNNKFL